jgi:glycosyltransferase involved in cell wall biosynthesis
MRVLIVIDDLRTAGAQRVIAQEVRELHPQRIDFHVAALARRPEQGFARELDRLGVPVHYVPGSGLVDPRRVAALRRLIDHVDPDLVHTHLTYANILGTLASALAGRPVVSSLHNVDINQRRWPIAKRRLEGFVLRHCAARVVVVSAAARLPTSRSFDVPVERLSVITNGVDPSAVAVPAGFDRSRMRRALGIGKRERLICTVARLDKSKGHRYLLEALAMLEPRRVRLVLMGSGPEEARLQEQATRLGVEDRVVFLGIRDDFNEIIAASDLFVLPSLNEGLSQALLEAMALGTPVVATNVGGTRDVLEPGRTGWRVPPAEPIALANAIQQALGRPETATAYARAAHSLVRHGFNLTTHVSGLQALYASVAGA